MLGGMESISFFLSSKYSNDKADVWKYWFHKPYLDLHLPWTSWADAEEIVLPNSVSHRWPKSAIFIPPKRHIPPNQGGLYCRATHIQQFESGRNNIPSITSIAELSPTRSWPSLNNIQLHIGPHELPFYAMTVSETREQHMLVLNNEIYASNLKEMRFQYQRIIVGYCYFIHFQKGYNIRERLCYLL